MSPFSIFILLSPSLLPDQAGGAGCCLSPSLTLRWIVVLTEGSWFLLWISTHYPPLSVVVIQRVSHNTKQTLSDAHFTSKQHSTGNQNLGSWPGVHDTRRVKKCTTSTFMAVVIFQAGTPIVQISWPCKNRRHSPASTEAYSEMGTAANTYFKNLNILQSLHKLKRKPPKIVLSWAERHTGERNSVANISDSAFLTLPYRCSNPDSTRLHSDWPHFFWQAWEYCTTCTASGSLSVSVYLSVRATVLC